MPDPKLPALPNDFPGHSRRTYPSLSKTFFTWTCLNLEELKLWIFGAACASPITEKLKTWRSELLGEFDCRNVDKILARTSHERLALVYFLDVLLLNGLKDVILKDGQEDAATSLCVGAMPSLRFTLSPLTQEKHVHRI